MAPKESSENKRPLVYGDDYNNILAISGLFTLLYIIVGLFSLFSNVHGTAILYGFFMGIAGLWVSYLLSWLIGVKAFHYLDFPKTAGFWSFIMRAGVLAGILCIAFYVTNKPQPNGMSKLLFDVNIFSMLVAYMTPFYASLILPWWTKDRISKKEIIIREFVKTGELKNKKDIKKVLGHTWYIKRITLYFEKDKKVKKLVRKIPIHLETIIYETITLVVFILTLGTVRLRSSSYARLKNLTITADNDNEIRKIISKGWKPIDSATMDASMGRVWEFGQKGTLRILRKGVPDKNVLYSQITIDFINKYGLEVVRNKFVTKRSIKNWPNNKVEKGYKNPELTLKAQKKLKKRDQYMIDFAKNKKLDSKKHGYVVFGKTYYPSSKLYFSKDGKVKIYRISSHMDQIAHTKKALIPYSIITLRLINFTLLWKERKYFTDEIKRTSNSIKKELLEKGWKPLDVKTMYFLRTQLEIKETLCDDSMKFLKKNKLELIKNEFVSKKDIRNLFKT